jgi:hypothetical protein
MKKLLYILPALLFSLAGETALGANFNPHADVIVMAASNAMELDVTMEMLDEDAQSSSDIINVIELPVQAMHQEQVRNQRRIRQDGDASPLRQEQGAPNVDQSEIMGQINEIQQDSEDAKRQAYDDMGQKKGR